jgi:hypothetical protein
MNLDKKHYIMIALLLAALATLGSMRFTYTKTIESLTVQNTKLTETVASQKTASESMRRDIETTETMTPMEINGKTVYVTTRTSKTVETAMKQSNEQIAKLTQQVTDLTSKTATKTDVTVKPAPFWNVVASSSVIEYADVTQWQAGGGVNIGTLSLTLTNPLSPVFRPRLQAMLRF